MVMMSKAGGDVLRGEGRVGCAGLAALNEDSV